MAETDFEGSFGSYHAESNSLALVIDQDSPSFNTVLKYQGELKITFTPHDNISDAQLAAALGATVSVTGSDLDKSVYGADSKAIWALDDTKTILLDANTNWIKGTDGVYTCVIPCSALNDIITLANTFNLPTIDDYNDFQKVQKLAIFRIKVTAGIIS